MRVRYASERETEKMINEWLSGTVGPLDLIKAPLSIMGSVGKGLGNAFKNGVQTYKDIEGAPKKAAEEKSTQEREKSRQDLQDEYYRSMIAKNKAEMQNGKGQTPTQQEQGVSPEQSMEVQSKNSAYAEKTTEPNVVKDNKVVAKPVKTQEKANAQAKTKKVSLKKKQAEIKKVASNQGDETANALYGSNNVEAAKKGTTPKDGVQVANDIKTDQVKKKAYAKPQVLSNKPNQQGGASNAPANQANSSNSGSYPTTVTMPRFTTNSTQNVKTESRKLRKALHEAIMNHQREHINEWVSSGGLGHALTLPNTRRAIEQWGEKMGRAMHGDYSNGKRSKEKTNDKFLKIRVPFIPRKGDPENFTYGIIEQGDIGVVDNKAEIIIDTSLQRDNRVSYNADTSIVTINSYLDQFRARGFVSKPGSKNMFGKTYVIVQLKP